MFPFFLIPYIMEAEFERIKDMFLFLKSGVPLWEEAALWLLFIVHCPRVTVRQRAAVSEPDKLFFLSNFHYGVHLSKLLANTISSKWFSYLLVE